MSETNEELFTIASKQSRDFYFTCKKELRSVDFPNFFACKVHLKIKGHPDVSGVSFSFDAAIRTKNSQNKEIRACLFRQDGTRVGIPSIGYNDFRIFENSEKALLEISRLVDKDNKDPSNPEAS
jgi:hypothetical protein